MMLCAIVLACVTAACTDPSGLGPAPSFIGLEPIANEVLARDPTRGLPDDSCPVIVISAAPTVRYNISGSSATIALPAGGAVTSVAFGREQGTVFNLDSVGMIAISYGNNFAVPSFTPAYFAFFGVVTIGERFQQTVVYPRWCAIRVGGRVAVLHLTYGVARNSPGEVDRIVYANDFSLRVAMPDGRQMNVRMLGGEYYERQDTGALPALTLLSHVATLQW